jgi:glycosyltransferase involved in cell wall biosynthesis
MDQWAVAMLGARMHYAVPRMLHKSGLLARFYTDICAVKGWPRLARALPSRWQPTALRRLLGRVPVGLPARQIRAFSRFGFQYARRRAFARTPGEHTEVHLWAGKRFCNLIIQEGLENARGVYTYNTAALELLGYARSEGMLAVLEQTIAPKDVEHRLMAEEQKRFPGWEPPVADERLADYCARERSEWNEAELILCGSEFVRQAIGACGGPVDRCVVVPYGVDGRFTVRERRPAHGPLRVLTVGAVGLMKGSPYVLEAARSMGSRAEFRMVGPLGVSEAAAQKLRRHVQLLGPITRTEIMDQYAWADVFLLPSLCEGSATVTYEALRSGLPVVCTRNTGSVVRDGVDGFVVPIRDIEAIVDRLGQMTRMPAQLHRMGMKAQERAKEFTLDQYQERLIAALKGEYESCVHAAK